MKYYVKQKIFSFKDKFYVKDSEQKDIFMIKGKMFSLSNQLDLLNMQEEVLLHASKQLFRFLPKYTIVTPTGEEKAVVKRVFSLKPKFEVTVGNEVLEVNGSFFAHSFQVNKDGKPVASISKKVMSFGDSYEIDILDKENELLYLFIVIIIDQTTHENKRGR